MQAQGGFPAGNVAERAFLYSIGVGAIYIRADDSKGPVMQPPFTSKVDCSQLSIHVSDVFGRAVASASTCSSPKIPNGLQVRIENAVGSPLTDRMPAVYELSRISMKTDLRQWFDTLALLRHSNSAELPVRLN